MADCLACLRLVVYLHPGDNAPARGIGARQLDDQRRGIRMNTLEPDRSRMQNVA
jgi:hypothetical protein